MQETVQPHSAGAPGVLTLLRHQASLFAQLESLSARQSDLVSRDDATPLLALLADRQRMARDLTRIGEQLEPARRDWASTRDKMTPAERDEADGLVTQVRDRMRRLIENDERDARTLSARQQTVAAALRQTQTVGGAVSAYRNHGPAGASHTRLDEAS